MASRLLATRSTPGEITNGPATGARADRTLTVLMVRVALRSSRWVRLDLLLQLGIQPRRRRASAARLRRGAWRFVRAALVVSGVGILLGAGLFTVRLWAVLHAISPHSSPTDLIVTLAHAQSDEPGSLGWKIKHDERINVLLLGYGGPGHDGPYLTDSIMLVSIKATSRQAVLI